MRSTFPFAEPTARSLGMRSIGRVTGGADLILSIKEVGVAVGNGNQQLGNKFVTGVRELVLAPKIQPHVNHGRAGV